jgi:hypothetical protein
MMNWLVVVASRVPLSHSTGFHPSTWIWMDIHYPSGARVIQWRSMDLINGPSGSPGL